MDNHAHTFNLGTPDGKDRWVQCSDCDHERFYPSSANSMELTLQTTDHRSINPQHSAIRRDYEPMERILLRETGFYQKNVKNYENM